jgi:hypothetical protein
MELTRKERVILKLINWLRKKLVTDQSTGKVIYIRPMSRATRGGRVVEGAVTLFYGPDATEDRILGQVVLTPEAWGGMVRNLDEAQRHMWGFAGQEAPPESQRAEGGVEVVAILNTATARLVSKAHVSQDEMDLWDLDRDPMVPHPVTLKMAHAHGRLAQKLFSNIGIIDDDGSDWSDE